MGGADAILKKAKEDYDQGNYRWVSQMGYQAESGPWRNFYLTGAQELRNDVVKAAGKTAVLNFDFTDTNQKYKLELENGVLNHTADAQSDKADATISLSRDTLNKIVLKEESLQQAKDKGEVKFTGDASKLDDLLNSMDKFEFWFNIVTP